jgi:BA14K-like protein
VNPNLLARVNFRITSAGTPLDIQAQPQQIDPRRKHTMTRFKMLGAAAILSMMIATPVFAQAAIQEPGAFAFYHPNADVLNGGRPTPAAGLGAMASIPYESTDAYAAMDEGTSGASCAQRYRSYDPGSGTFFGYDGRRHPCE